MAEVRAVADLLPGRLTRVFIFRNLEFFIWGSFQKCLCLFNIRHHAFGTAYRVLTVFQIEK